MAFYAELKRRHWYCFNGFNAIRWYSDLLYQQWYKSLSDEQKERLKQYHEEKDGESRHLARFLLSIPLLYNNWR